MRVMGIDPGSTHSAWVIWDGARIEDWNKNENEDVMRELFHHLFDVVVIEQVASYGMPVGAEVFATCHWSGRFHQCADGLGFPVHLMPRKDVKLHICQSPRANDATIRQALIDRFGGKDKAIGKKATPGPLYGLKADCWQALALAVTWWDTHRGDAMKTPEEAA